MNNKIKFSIVGCGTILFYEAFKPFKEMYNNYRDDHVSGINSDWILAGCLPGAKTLFRPRRTVVTAAKNLLTCVTDHSNKRTWWRRRKGHEWDLRL